MENKVYVIHRNITAIFFGLLFFCGTYFAFKYSETFLGLLSLICGVVSLFWCSLFNPWCYVFDMNGISICYLFDSKLCFLWKNVNSVVLMEEIVGRGSVVYKYKILGTPNNKPKFYMKNEIIKSKKTEKMLEEYFDRGLVDFSKKIKSKKIKPNFEYNIKIADMENYQKSQTEKYISHFHSELANIGLCLKTSYAYLSDEDEDVIEYEVRPKGNSTYSAIFRISRPDEIDKNKIFEFDVALIDFSEEKDRVRASDNQMIVSTLSVFDELVDEIMQNGIDKFLEDDSI